MIFGTRAVIEAIRAGKELESVYIQRDATNDLIKELKAELAGHNLSYQKVPLEKLNRLTRKNHQGVVAFISPINYADLDNVISSVYEKGEMPLVLILDRITDVRNVGAIARTAECLGAHALVVPSRGGARIGADAVKTSAGALHHIPVCREDNLKDTISRLREAGLKTVACTEKGDKPLAKADLTGPAALIMGSEEDGVSEEYLKLADQQVLIPMIGQIESLNVSVAAAICLYEVVRQRS
jgi:23S rRNA (guanosine2251-2'-O)-methyltransferase